MWNLKKPKSEKQRVEWWLPGAARWEKWRDIGQRAQTFSYKINKFWGSNVQNGDLANKHCIIYSRAAEIVDLQFSQHKKEMVICDGMEV